MQCIEETQSLAKRLAAIPQLKVFDTWSNFILFKILDARVNSIQLRDHLLSLLQGRNAHISFDDFVKDFPAKVCGQEIEGLPYTAWQVLEHIRIAQWDIVNFIKNPDYEELKWPEGYWPAKNAKATKEDWENTLARFKSDLREMIAIVRNPRTDLHAKIPHGDGQTILREAILIVDHNTYHIGEFAILRQVAKHWS